MRFLALVIATLTVAVIVAAPSRATSSTDRQLQDAHVGTTKSELVAQRNYSSAVVRRLTRSWMPALRHASCWSHVPWARTCDRARRTLLAHRWLLNVAARKLARLYPPRRAPTVGPTWLVNAFLCIHSHEGTWASNTGNGYYGGEQFGWSEWQTYGGRYAARADLATPAQQIAAAIAYWRVSGFTPWPRTAPMCGV